MFGLWEEGVVPPPTEAIAERAGVSVSSIFRHFESLDDLQREAIERHFARFAPLYDIPAMGVGGLDDRIDRLVAARIELYTTIAPIARLTRARAIEQPRIARTLAQTRSSFTGQIRSHFARELGELTPARAEDLVALIDGLTSFEAWDLQHSALERSDRQIRRAWVAGVRALVREVGVVDSEPRASAGAGTRP